MFCKRSKTNPLFHLGTQHEMPIYYPSKEDSWDKSWEQGPEQEASFDFELIVTMLCQKANMNGK